VGIPADARAPPRAYGRLTRHHPFKEAEMTRTTITRRAATALALAALAVPASASADQYMYSPQDRPPFDIAAVTAGSGDSVATPPVSQPQAGDGFAWGDAGIGAAAVLTALGLGGAALAAGRHRHATRTVAG
jgi:hypothetical protein